MREEVIKARRVQAARFEKSRTRHNAQMTTKEIRRHCELDAGGHNLLKTAVNEMGLSARAHDKVLRVSRTIADLEGSDTITQPHVSEAVNYRLLDRQMWT